MLTINPQVKRGLLTIGIYVAVIATTLYVVAHRMRAQAEIAAHSRAALTRTPVDPSAKPYFSLSTNRTFGTSDRARLWLNYQNVNQIDIRVYRVKDPVKFFKQLDDPHQVGEDEKAGVSGSYRRRPSLLEKIRQFKVWCYGAIKDYIRDQLKRDSRVSFNQKFRAPNDERSRLPLNVADYARVPLLNPDQLVSSWREKLPPLEDEYEGQIISLGKREPGVYLVEAVNGDLRAYSVAIITDLTMINKTTREGEVLVYAVDRKSGAPHQGVRVEIVKEKATLATGATDKRGVFQIRVERKSSGEEAEEPAEEAEAEDGSGPSDSYLVMASERDHFAINDLESFYYSEFEGEGGDTGLTSYVYTDRPVYRPNQKAYFKGILRRLTAKGYEMVKGDIVSVSVEDPNGEKIYQQDLRLSARGTFNGEVDIAGEAPLGNYRVIAQVGEAEASGNFEVQEYKKPEYKVKVSAPKKFIPVGEKMKFTVEARYFFGAPVANAEVKYYIYRSRYYRYWWRNEDTEDEFAGISEDEDEGGYYGYGDNMADEGEGTLDAHGRLSVEFQVPQPEEKDAWDYEYRLEAQVTDAARRTIDGAASFVGTRGSVIAHAMPERYLYFQGDTAKIEVKTTDYEGRPVPTRVTLKFSEERWDKVKKQTESGYEYDDFEMHERELTSTVVETNAQGMASLNYTVPMNGDINIKTIVNEGNREIVNTGGSFWVADRNNKWADYAYEDYGSIKLIPDKKSYKPGEIAHVLALLPTDKAHLLVTTELMSVMTVRQIESFSRAIVIDVPVEARYAPNVFLNVSYIKDSEMYTGDQMLVVPARDKILKVDIVPNKKEFKPRDTASYTILARNADGSPAANAEVSLGVVDEAIYSIQPEMVGDIRREFYGRRYNQVQTSFSISYIFTGYAGDKPVTLAQNKKAYQLADFKNESQFAEPTIRREFKDTAFWQADAVTDGSGKATLNVKLPDNLTTWRATARAVTAETRVGAGIAKVVSRKDVILRLAMPRFMTDGDTATLSGIVHNFLPADKTTQISIEVNGANLIDAPMQTVTIPKNGEYRVNWRVNAPRPGEMKLLAKALTDTESDAVEMTMEVVPHGLRQASGGMNILPEEDVEKTFSYDLPANADPYARTLRIEAAPSIAGTLFGALDYLTGYPYGCTEQTMSQFLPNVIVAKTLQEVRTATISDTNNLNKKVQRGFDRLYSYQHSDGGWGWWKNDPTDPYMTAYVIDGLMLARNAGYGVDDERLSRGRDKLKEMIDSGKDDNDKTIDAETRSFMIYALNESGGMDSRYADELFSKRGSLQPYGRALLALLLKQRGDGRAREVAGEIERSASVNEFNAHWESTRKAMLDFSEDNDIEATALSVKALAQINPRSPVLGKAARWLVSNRRHGYYWNSTKDTAFAIYGLVDYIKTSQELTPDYTVEVYVNDEQVLSQHVTSAEATAAQPFTLKRKGNDVGNQTRVRVVKRGRGVLYLSASLEYFTADEQVAAQAVREMKITREYLRLRVSEDADKPGWKIEPFSGELRSGDIIVSRLHIEGARAQYVMIEDPIPAGCEQIERISSLNLNYSEKGWSDWYSAREFRDNRTVFFLNYFDGKATFQYAMRVQVPGDFRIAPARTELMYQPTVRANTANGRMSILERK